jgi:hypothetical protein
VLIRRDSPTNGGRTLFEAPLLSVFDSKWVSSETCTNVAHLVNSDTVVRKRHQRTVVRVAFGQMRHVVSALARSVSDISTTVSVAIGDFLHGCQNFA